jgi:hypothetical protein
MEVKMRGETYDLARDYAATGRSLFFGYVRFKLSFRNLIEMMAELAVSLVHATIMRRIAGYVHEFEKRWNRFPVWD